MCLNRSEQTWKLTKQDAQKTFPDRHGPRASERRVAMTNPQCGPWKLLAIGLPAARSLYCNVKFKFHLSTSWKDFRKIKIKKKKKKNIMIPTVCYLGFLFRPAHHSVTRVLIPLVLHPSYVTNYCFVRIRLFIFNF